MNHKGTITLETQRLILRRFAPDDAPALFCNMSTVIGNSLEEVEIYFRDKWLDFYESLETYQWLVVLKSLGEPIGT